MAAAKELEKEQEAGWAWKPRVGGGLLVAPVDVIDMHQAPRIERCLADSLNMMTLR